MATKQRQHINDHSPHEMSSTITQEVMQDSTKLPYRRSPTDRSRQRT